MSAAKFRATRFRVSDADALLPPPLPLINLPDEVRLARTGVPGLRPTYLPVRRHVVESSGAGSGSVKLQPSGSAPACRDPEPILRESRMLVESEAEEDEAREVVARVHVYEYNQSEVFENSGASEDTLVFDALFESGNLQRAERIYRQHESGKMSQVKRHEYELMIHPDIKNSAYRQWFYFEVRNGKPGVVYKFALVNLAKSGALFGSGLQPVVYSEIDAETKGVGWVHRGSHVRYDVSLSPDSAPGTTCLSFRYEFEHENDRVYFACLQPYTYTDLTEYLENLERDPERAAVCRRTELCQSIAQNSVDLLSITSSGKDGIPHDDKRVIVISARVHPGEPNSSWMMKGMIDYLTGASSGAQVLRRNFLFKVVPMLNPDGVINGNTRVNLAGWDLNRKWSCPVEKLFPTVYHLKRQIANLQARDRVAIYCDLHGHSLNRNIFTYGCYNKKCSKRLAAAAASLVGASYASTGASTPSLNLGCSASSSSSANSAAATNFISRASVKNDPRVFPMIVAKNSQFFSFASCDFKVHKSKLNTARVVVNHELGVINSYTLEASFCGPDFGPRKDTQFSTWDLEDMGKSWCQSLLIYFDLVAEVKALDAQLLLRSQKQQAEAALVSSSGGSGGGGDSGGGGSGPDSKLVATAATATTLEMTSSLLSDCEAAISELFANAEEVEYDDDLADMASMDSDLSGAEDEPIPPNHQTSTSIVDDLFLFDRVSGVGARCVDDYSSVPEDGGDDLSPEKAALGGDSRRRKSRNGRKKLGKKSSGSGSGSKRSKSKSKKEKASKAKDLAADAAIPAAEDTAALEPNVKKKTSKLRRKKSSGAKKECSRSFRGLPKQKAPAGSDDSEQEEEETHGGDDEEADDDEGEEASLVRPLISARLTPPSSADMVVLPSMPGSADRRRLKALSLTASGQQQDGGSEVDDQLATTSAALTDDRRFLCPTPPTQKGRAKLVRTGSPPPIELPMLRHAIDLQPPRRGSFKERILEAYGVTGRHTGSTGHKNDDDDDSDGGDDSDASGQSGPESYLSEF